MEDPPRTPESAATRPRAERLEARRREVRAQLAGLDEELAALRRTREGLSDDDEHDPDGVPLSAQWSRLEGLRAAKLEALAAIDASEARSARGVGDLCITCGGPIAAARLVARPEATTCIDCAP